MKRGADKQLTQDDPESQGDDNVTSYLFLIYSVYSCVIISHNLKMTSNKVESLRELISQP